MNRRQSIRQGILFAIGMALGKMDTLKAEGGELLVPLDQWKQVVFKLQGKTVTIGVHEIFNALVAGAEVTE